MKAVWNPDSLSLSLLPISPCDPSFTSALSLPSAALARYPVSGASKLGLESSKQKANKTLSFTISISGVFHCRSEKLATVTAKSRLPGPVKFIIIVCNTFCKVLVMVNLK